MKPLRRLNSALLARKGSAAPSTDMRPEEGLLDRMVAPLPYSPVSDEAETPAEPGPTTPFYSSVHARPRISIRNPAKGGIQTKPVAKKSSNTAERVAMTVRMDEDQHIKLKVYCAHAKKSAQEVFLEALDAFVASHQDDVEMADCACFRSAKKTPEK